MRRSLHFPRAGLSPRALLQAALLIAFAACHVTPYQRKLPDSIRRVYVPMAINRTAEPGLEEVITNAFAEQILKDGRLDLVRKGQADAVIQITIENYTERSSFFTLDDVEAVRQVALTASLELFDPADLENRFAYTPSVITNYSYDSHYRSTVSTLGVDARLHLAAAAGADLLNALMNRVEMTRE